MVAKKDLDRLFLDIEGVLSVDVPKFDISESSLVDVEREVVAAKIRHVIAGLPVRQLLYLAETDLAEPALSLVNDAKLHAVQAELSSMDFLSHWLPEPAISNPNPQEQRRYITRFRWLGNAVCDDVKLVAMEKSVTCYPGNDYSQVLGEALEVLLFNGAASEEELIHRNIRERTISKFTEYRDQEAA